MLPLKIYNELPVKIRLRLARIVFSHMGENFITQMATPFHHNFNHDGGRWYKLMLQQFSLDKEKKCIKVNFKIPIQ